MTTRIPISAIRLFAGATAALAVAGTLVACSSSKTSGSGAAATSQPAPASSGSSSSSSSGARPARGVRPAAQGTIAALAATSMEVQSPQSGQVTVTFGPKTAFTQTSAAAKASVVVGTCVAAVAARSQSSGSAAPSTPAPSASPPARVTSFTAATVVITQRANGTCNGGFGGLNGSAAPSGAPSGAFPSGAPSGGFGRGGFGGFAARATGKVTAVTASTMTVVGSTRSGPITYTVSVDPSTMYTATGSGTSASLAVGQCVIAFGPTDSTGAVAATRIAVSPASSSGCTVGFGRGRPGGASGRTGG
ncbi:MAG TPA: DUF5666 domain-containing protein [Jatrophihabitantaceae bacterium]|nr:DUF5666 domain-containing protein [Jatrophihabitantaceae bacterium]